MAEKENHKIADQAAIADNDPFAELTRLMGFDPRQPVRPATTVANKPMMAEPGNALADDIDFGIDLERELLGDLGLDELDMPASDQADQDRFPAAEAVDGAEENVASPLEETTIDFLDTKTYAEAEAEPQAGEAMAGTSDAPAAAVEAVAPESRDEGGNSDLFAQVPIDSSDTATFARTADAVDERGDLAEAEMAEAAGAQSESPPAQAPGNIDTIEGPAVLIAEHALEEVEQQAGGGERDYAEAPAASAVEAADPSAQADRFPAHDEDWYDAPDLQLDREFDTVFAEAQRVAGAEARPVRESVAGRSSEADLVAKRANPKVRPGQDLAVHDLAPEAALEMSLEAELNALLGNAAELASSAPAHPVQRANRLGQGPATMVDPAADDWSEELAMHRLVEQFREEPAPAKPIDVAERSDRNQTPGPVQPVHQVAADDDLDGIFDDEDLEAALSSAVSGAFEETSGDARRSEAEAARKRESENFMPRVGRDPYAALAAMSADLRPTRSWPDSASQDAYFDRQSQLKSGGAARLEAPEIETVDVPEQAVALADDLDLPELALEDETARATHYDDIDAEFSTLLAGMNAGVSHPEPATQPRFEHNRPIRMDQPRDEAYYDERGAPAFAAAAAAGLADDRSDPFPGYDAAYSDSVGNAAAGAGGPRGNGSADLEPAYDPDFDEDIAGPAYAPITARPARRRGILVAAVVGGVAVLGGIAAFALSFGDSQGVGEVALVKADASPVKVKPENPGGATIPNQDSKVYNSVAGAGAAGEPTQEKLLNSAEEPVEVPMPQDEPVDTAMADEEPADDLAPVSGTDTDETADASAESTPKGEDRIEQLIEDPGVDTSMEVAAVAPRKVRTMIVKADGSLVAREEPVAPQAVDSASEGIVDPVASTAAPAAEDSQTTATVPNPAAEEAPAAAAGTASGTTPKTVPVAPARPSDQPVDIVGEVKAERVAALDPAATPAPGSWSMQIASQPTEAAAQSSYKDLHRRYGKVLGDRQATIVKAEIAGKGTFWRVRVPAGSRNEAVKLCESYKSAGGSCFVSK